MKFHLFIYCLIGVWPFAATADGVDYFCQRFKQTMSNGEILNAIGAGHINELVACGLPINQPIQINPIDDGVTPLQFAAASGKPQLVEQAIRAGADPNFGGAGEVVLYPLDLALTSRKYAAAKALIHNKARVDYAVPQSGMTALMAAAFDAEFGAAARDVTTELIKRGADVNAVDVKGGTPLHWAARAGNAKYIKVLLAAHADACIKNIKGQRPADVVSKKHPQLKPLLDRRCEAAQ